MGSLYRRGKIWWLKYHHNGKPVRESSKSDRKMVAKKLLELREGELARGRVPSYQFEKITFDELAEDLVTDYRVNGKKSEKKIRQMLRLYLVPFFGGRSATFVNTSEVKRYICKRQDAGAANGTINRELTALKRMMNLGLRHMPPKVDRVPHIPMLKEDNIRKGFFEQDEFYRLLEALPDYLKVFSIFAYRTGWRFAEIAELTWDRVDMRRGVARLESGQTKSGDGRTVFMDHELSEAMRRRFTTRQLGCPYVFHRDGGRIKNYYPVWGSACKSVGLEGKLFHDLRRTAVRNMIRAGVPERVAMMISGHKTRSVFDRYNIVSEEDLRRAARQQESYLENQ